MNILHFIAAVILSGILFYLLYKKIKNLEIKVNTIEKFLTNKNINLNKKKNVNNTINFSSPEISKNVINKLDLKKEKYEVEEHELEKEFSNYEIDEDENDNDDNVSESDEDENDNDDNVSGSDEDENDNDDNVSGSDEDENIDNVSEHGNTSNIITEEEVNENNEINSEYEKFMVNSEKEILTIEKNDGGENINLEPESEPVSEKEEYGNNGQEEIDNQNIQLLLQEKKKNVLEKVETMTVKELRINLDEFKVYYNTKTRKDELRKRLLDKCQTLN